MRALVIVMEAELHGGQEGNENSTNPIGGVEREPGIAIKSEETEIVCEEDGILERKVKEAEAGENDCDCVIDVDKQRGGGSSSGESSGEEKVCRICQVSSEHTSESSELIQLGCSCKGELGVSHRHCAETWFRQRGNRQCEICGKTARNITAIEDIRLLVEWHEMRLMATGAASAHREGSCLWKKNFCNFLLACIVLGFIFSWFFRVHIL
uniref:RING-CH-type domain-containing protein n=1 Tax=Davidia involucrata TaxID=16924 RepID=A0A5B7BDP5_DAVIN